MTIIIIITSNENNINDDNEQYLSVEVRRCSFSFILFSTIMIMRVTLKNTIKAIRTTKII